MIDFESDLDILFNDFGVNCSFLDEFGSSYAFFALRLGSQEIYERGLGDLIISGTNPVLLCKTSSISEIKDNNDVILGGVTYRLVHFIPDPNAADGKLSILFLTNDYL